MTHNFLIHIVLILSNDWDGCANINLQIKGKPSLEKEPEKDLQNIIHSIIN